MNIELNGEQKELDENTSVSKLLETFSLKPDRVVVEINKEILDRNDYSATNLKENDSLEVIQFVPGG